jgi:5-methyltetrahydropteroyltriglutamate--homocysteine methyltransferase
MSAPDPVSRPETLLPTTMVGSYPRPHWFVQQLAERDFLRAMKDMRYEEAYIDATRSAIADQEAAGLDILTDGQMWFDDYTMGIGSFLWYWFERIDGFDRAKYQHPARSKAAAEEFLLLDEAGGARVTGKIGPGRCTRLPELYKIAQGLTARPIKCCVGAGPVQLSGLCYTRGSPYKNWKEVAGELAAIFNDEMKQLVAVGAKFIQLEDLGAWYPNLSGQQDSGFVTEVFNRTLEGVEAELSFHFCLGNAWGNVAHAMTKGGYGRVLPWYFDVNVKEYVLDFACREMNDIAVLKQLPKDKRIAAGVIDVRSFEVEAPEQVAARIRALLAVIEPERITLTTDCGMKQLPRVVARNKLNSLVAGARIVRAELTGKKG